MQLDLLEQDWRLRVTYTKSALTAAFLERTYRVVCHTRDRVPLQRCRFELEGGYYSWRVWLQDGRLWQQTVTFSSDMDHDPGMTFHVPAQWRQTEFSALRELRQLAIDWRVGLGATLFRLDQSTP